MRSLILALLPTLLALAAAPASAQKYEFDLAGLQNQLPMGR
ncbi:hypothetical protein RX327_21545 [Bradyrhizobium sp. BEA-2-5]|nr:hypothetical protein [Bradyrhizobium sp. BEA-2-5]WOH78525.1 hypothetical protein RX327_21545 [Bradyrhizobium sp. BEA-2-5]